MSTEGGIEGVRIGRLHIGLISRPLTQSEKGKLLYLPIARSMTGIVIHKSIAVDNLTEAQICDVFSGKLKSWKELGANDANITVLTRKRDDNNTETFREKMACFKDLVITAQAIALVRGNEVLAALDKRPGTVGIVNLGSNYRDYENIKAVPINSISPTAETARTEKYRYFSERGLITQGEPHGLTKRFIEFMLCLDEIRGRLAECFGLKDHKLDHVLHGAIASAAVYGAVLGATAEQIESAIGLMVAHYVPFRAIRHERE